MSLSHLTLEIPISSGDGAEQSLFERTKNFYINEMGFTLFKRNEEKNNCKSVVLHSLGLVKSSSTSMEESDSMNEDQFLPIYLLLEEVNKEKGGETINLIVNGEKNGVKIDPLGNKISCLHKSEFPLVNGNLTRRPSKIQLSTLERNVSSYKSSSHLSELPGYDGTSKKLAFLTSGGDCSGMNASIRSIVRYALTMNCEPYAVYEGYQGLVDGGDKIVKFNWNDVTGILSKGGTIIGSARCKDFRERSGRLRAAFNLVSRGIDCLIVNGGDGSLTGANLFRTEWKSLIEQLVKEGKVAEEVAQKYQNLTIVGMVGSIDNDMVGTELTIGANTSLHRIVEAVDSISSTATSHQRAFIIEVMGRNCGWLALMAALATGADWTLIPEKPPLPNWEDEMCESLRKHRELGKRRAIVIVAEGAIDSQNNAIRSEYVKDLLTKRLNLDTRVTTLGHVQRGGIPSAFDRILGSLQGIKAVQVALTTKTEDEPVLIGYNENKITDKPLMKCVEMTKAVGMAIAERNFTKAFELRDPDFKDAYSIFNNLRYRVNSGDSPVSEKKRIAFLNIGAPSAGMNASSRAIVRYCVNRGHIPLAIYNGFDGLAQGDIKEMNWIDVDGWSSKAGSEIGTNRTLPERDFGRIAFQMQKFQIHGLVLVGGFEAFNSLLELESARSKYPAFCIPMICLPATISNNVPGTEYSIGSDTGLNAIVDSCDTIKCSATASRNRLFVVEVQGANCGYLATLGGLAAGAVRTYIAEEKLNLAEIQRDIVHLRERFSEDKRQGRIILRNENCSETYTTEVLTSIFHEEGQPIFDSRNVILGHLQQGRSPTPLDRVRGTRLAVLCVQFIEEWISKRTSTDSNGPLVYTNEAESACLLGIRDARVVYTPVKSLLAESDMKKRVPKTSWWQEIRPLVKMLAKY